MISFDLPYTFMCIFIYRFYRSSVAVIGEFLLISTTSFPSHFGKKSLMCTWLFLKELFSLPTCRLNHPPYRSWMRRFLQLIHSMRRIWPIVYENKPRVLRACIVAVFHVLTKKAREIWSTISAYNWMLRIVCFIIVGRIFSNQGLFVSFTPLKPYQLKGLIFA